MKHLHPILQDLGRDEDNKILLHKALLFILKEPSENGDSRKEGNSPLRLPLIDVVSPRDDDDVVVLDQDFGYGFLLLNGGNALNRPIEIRLIIGGL